MPQADGTSLSIPAQARAYGVSKSVMAADRAAGCQADEEGGLKWRALHRRPYLRPAKILDAENSTTTESSDDNWKVPSSTTGSSVPASQGGASQYDKTTSITGQAGNDNNGNGEGTTAESLGRLRALEQSLARSAEAAFSRGDVAEGLSISRQHAVLIGRLVSTETAWAKLRQRQRDLVPTEWLIKFTYAYRRPIARVIDDYLAKRDDPELRRVANDLEQIVKSFSTSLEAFVNGSA